MYFRILKKDLKRKKTMNVILLLFVILSAMFAASSVNNIVAVVNGLDYYFDKAGMTDYFSATRGEENDIKVDEFLKDSEYVTDYGTEEIIYTTSESFRRGGDKLYDFSNVGFVQNVDGCFLNLFTADNKILKSVDEGKVYISGAGMRKADIEPGDKITFEMNGVTKEFEFAGFLKDALFGSEMIGNPRFLINDKDYKDILKDETTAEYSKGRLYYINYTDKNAFEESTAEISPYLVLNFSRSMIEMTNIMNMTIAAILLVLSVGLLVVSFTVLRFTISFTISEEFREIGVMKALGLKNTSIRGLYLVKYFGISVIGAVIGYFASVPFGKILLASVSQNMVLGNDNSVLYGILCSIGVVLIIMLFCWSCTKKIKKLSPIDAVRNGQTGERFKKRGVMSLSKSRLGSTGFLTINDILSAPRQFGMIMLIFTISTAIVMILSTTARTLASDSLLYLMSVTESDVFLSDSERSMNTIASVKSIEDTNREIEDILKENDMPGDVKMESWYKIPTEFGSTKKNITFMWCRDTKTTDYEYTEGTAPELENEVALTKLVADDLGCGIGDTIKLTINDKTDDYVVTAIFQCFNNLGSCGRLNENLDMTKTPPATSFYYQIEFDDHPDDKVIEERIEKLKDIFDTENVFDKTGFTKDCMGVADTLATVRDMVLILTLVIIVLISILMERSFITKEKSEIALMKALGFRSDSIIGLHTARFAAVLIAAEIIAAALSIPLTSLIMDPVFGMMGAIGKIEYKFDPKEIFLIYPAIILAVTTLSAFFTSLYTKSIKASDTSNIE